jgi:hypothetical protein
MSDQSDNERGQAFAIFYGAWKNQLAWDWGQFLARAGLYPTQQEYTGSCLAMWDRMHTPGVTDGGEVAKEIVQWVSASLREDVKGIALYRSLPDGGRTMENRQVLEGASASESEERDAWTDVLEPLRRQEEPGYAELEGRDWVRHVLTQLQDYFRPLDVEVFVHFLEGGYATLSEAAMAWGLTRSEYNALFGRLDTVRQRYTVTDDGEVIPRALAEVRAGNHDYYLNS